MTPTRQEMIDRIYSVVKPTTFLEGDFSDIEYVMIGDMLDRGYKDKKYISLGFTGGKTCADGCGYSGGDEFSNNIMYRWQELRKPLEDQSDSCIFYIYSLVTQ